MTLSLVKVDASLSKNHCATIQSEIFQPRKFLFQFQMVVFLISVESLVGGGKGGAQGMGPAIVS